MKRWDKKVVTGHERAHKATSISEELGVEDKKQFFNDGYLNIKTEAAFKGWPELSYARYLLILKIVGGMKGGAFGVMRMWQGFRNKCGGSNTGITFSEFKHGLKMYGLNFEPKLQVEMFHSIDKNDSGGIQIFEFIDHLMGRWSSDFNSMQELGRHEEEALMKLAREIAAVKLRRKAVADSKVLEELKEIEEIKRRSKKKPSRVPIWKRSQRPATAGASLRRNGGTLKPLVSLVHALIDLYENASYIDDRSSLLTLFVGCIQTFNNRSRKASFS